MLVAKSMSNYGEDVAPNAFKNLYHIGTCYPKCKFVMQRVSRSYTQLILLLWLGEILNICWKKLERLAPNERMNLSVMCPSQIWVQSRTNLPCSPIPYDYHCCSNGPLPRVWRNLRTHLWQFLPVWLGQYDLTLANNRHQFC